VGKGKRGLWKEVRKAHRIEDTEGETNLLRKRVTLSLYGSMKKKGDLLPQAGAGSG